MATLRPAVRLVSRRIFTTTSISQSLRLAPAQLHAFHPPSTRRYKSDNSSIPIADRPVAVPGPSTSGDASKADTGTSDRSTSTPAPGEHLSSGIEHSKVYSFDDIKSMTESSPSQSRIIIDVREPSEVLGTGRIPGSKNLPISTSPDSFFLSAEEFQDRFGWERPGKDTEVVFYCKAGVRSRAAARLAGQAGFGGKIGEYPGSWVEWSGKGGMIEKAD